MRIDFRWETVGQQRTGWWWQKHSWNEWRQVVTTGKAVAAAEGAAPMVDATIVGSLEATKACSEGFGKSFEDMTTEGTVVQAAEAAGAEEAVATTTEETWGAATEAVEATEAMGAVDAATKAATAKVAATVTAVEWRCFLAASKEAVEGWRQFEAADQDVQQWVQEVEQQATTRGAEIVEEMWLTRVKNRLRA